MADPIGYIFAFMTHIDTPVYTCIECGLLTSHPEVHDEWHDWLTARFRAIEGPVGLLQ